MTFETVKANTQIHWSCHSPLALVTTIITIIIVITIITIIIVTTIITIIIVTTIITIITTPAKWALCGSYFLPKIIKFLNAMILIKLIHILTMTKDNKLTKLRRCVKEGGKKNHPKVKNKSFFMRNLYSWNGQICHKTSCVFSLKSLGLLTSTHAQFGTKSKKRIYLHLA